MKVRNPMCHNFVRPMLKKVSTMCNNVKEAVTSSLQVRDNAGTRWHSSPSLDANHNLRLLVMAFNLVVCDSNPDITEIIREI